MPKSSSPPEDDRFSPYRKSITKPISKSLLIPCRRVGLSRKKTPSTPLNTPVRPTITNNETPTSTTMKLEKSITEVSNREPKKKSTLNFSTKTKVDEGNPISSEEIKQSKKGQSLEDKSGFKQNISGNKSTKEEFRKKKLTEVKKTLTESEVDVPTVNQIEAKKSIKEQVGTKPTLKISTAPAENEIIIIKSEDSSDDEPLIMKKQKSSCAKVLFTKSSSDEEISSSLESISVTQNKCKLDHGFEEPHDKEMPQWRRTLSLKKIANKEQPAVMNAGSNVEQFKITPCSVNLQTLTSTECNKPTEEFKALVAAKHKLVQELKQAEVYTKLHNLGNLEQLTSVWKRGCISGLEDLLIQLRTHADIDMHTLLTNLRIPNHYISLSTDGILE